MKKFVAILGFLAGVMLGVALLLLNPITLSQPTPVGLAGAVRALDWQGGRSHRGRAATATGLLGLDSGTAPFDDAALRNARIDVVAFGADGELPGAIAVRLSTTADDNSIIEAQLGTDVHWNIVWPGAGSVLLSGSENLWAPLRDASWSALRGRGWQPGGERYLLPPLPGAGQGRVVAGSGSFAGAGGGFREQFLPDQERPGDFIGRRQLQLVTE